MTPTIDTIVVATDFAAASNAALQHARGLAKQYRASLHVVHVVEDPFVNARFSNPFDTESAELHRRMVKLAQDHLADMAASIGNVPLATHVVTGRAASTIVQFAEEVKADLIVMGTHGRRGIAHLVLGSIAEEVLRNAPCPVVAVRATHAAPTAARRRAVEMLEAV